MQRDLVERAMVGDHEAFSELARLWIDRLYAIARLILRDDDAAQDATRKPSWSRGVTCAWSGIRNASTLAAPGPGPCLLPGGAPGEEPSPHRAPGRPA